ncbi:MAG: ABC transporter substrate-binding protein, partial [Acetobacteraceae bacterium]
MLMSTRRDFLATLAPAVSAAVLAPPRLAMAQGTPRGGGVLRVGFISDSKTFDPIFSVEFTERYVLYLVYNTLVQYGPDFSIRPELAERWSVGNGGKDMTFVLRRGVKFQDGTDFTADVVKWNIDRRLDPAVGSPQRKELASIIDSVEVVDPATVTFHLKEPSPVLLSLLGERPGFMVSPAAAKKYGQDFGSHPVGTGPFLFKEWVRGSHIAVVRNPSYWESGKPYLDRIEFQDTPDSVVAIQRMLAQEVDYADQISPQEVKEIEHRKGVDLYPSKVGRWYFLQWHVDQPPFNNLKLRQAVAYAIDKERINGIVMNGRGQISQGPTPPGLWWYDPKVQSYPYDTAKAKQMLAEAGYLHGFDYVLSTPQIEILQEINQLVQA